MLSPVVMYSHLSLFHILSPNCYLLIFLFIEITENSKKGKFDKSSFRRPISYFGMNKAIFRVYVFIHACVKFRIGACII